MLGAGAVVGASVVGAAVVDGTVVGATVVVGAGVAAGAVVVAPSLAFPGSPPSVAVVPAPRSELHAPATSTPAKSAIVSRRGDIVPKVPAL
jgi:hypothetical protein